MAELYNSYSLEKTNNEISGSFTLWQDTPTSPYDIGDTFRPFPEAPLLSVKKVNINDNVVGQVNGKLFRQWQVVIEGSTSEQTEAQETDNIKYNFEINPETKSGSMEVINKGKNPILNLTVGSKFNIPGIGKVTCTSIKGNDSYNDNGAHIWTITYEGSTTETTEEILPNDEVTISYELNGTTVRTIDGEFLALRRSNTPITKKSIVVYNNSENAVATIGSQYQGGIALSENIIKEKIEKNGIVISFYYKHTIEVES